MKMPDDAVVKPFEDTDLGSLLVGQFLDKGPSFVAVRTERQESTGDATPYMAILSSWVDNQEHPYLYSRQSQKVLDLGHDWSIDVSIDESAPDFQGDPAAVLVCSDADFFICLERGTHFLDVANGALVQVLSDGNNVAYWSAFAIYLHQPGMDGPGAEIFRWPHKEGSPSQAGHAKG